MTCDESVKHQNPDAPICEMDIKGDKIMLVSCLTVCWEPVCSSDLEKPWTVVQADLISIFGFSADSMRNL